MLKIVFSFALVCASLHASADIMWGQPSNNPPPKKESGWGDLLGDLLGEVIQSPEVLGAVCDALPKEAQAMCRAGVGDPEAREKAYTLCEKAGSGYAAEDCIETASQGNFSLPAVNFCGKVTGNVIFHVEACLKNINNASFDEAALNKCATSSSYYIAEECLDAIRNKYYDEGNLRACRGGDYAMVSCLENTGINIGR